MDWVQSVILALIQGITEFLPISSSAHLILPSEIFSWPDQGLAFDVAVHLGTLAAVVIYFRDDIVKILVAWTAQFRGKNLGDDGRLGWFIIIATIPAGLIGLLASEFVEEYLRSQFVIGLSTIFFGLILFWADKNASQTLRIQDLSIKLVILIGCAQALALIPGTSRSGITITAALILGLTRVDSARFSFLMSIPIISLSGLFMSFDMVEQNAMDPTVLLIGVVVSSLSAYLCIHFFLRFISKMSMTPFVIYRLILGLALLGHLYLFS